MLAIALTLIFLLKSVLVVLALGAGAVLTMAGAMATVCPGLFLWDIAGRHAREIDVEQRAQLFRHLQPNLEKAGGVVLTVGLLLFLLGAHGLLALMITVI